MPADSIRLAVGTFTRYPVRPPSRVDTHVARNAMLMAPFVGIAMGAVTGLPLLAVGRMPGPTLGTLLLAAITVTLAAIATRAMHWDGLADTTDALASGKPPHLALDIARRSDLGPMGALAVVLTAILQVSGLAAIDSPWWAYGTWVGACCVGRLGVLIACTRGIPAARSEGLGAAVAGSVPVSAIVSVVTVFILVSIAGLAMGAWWLIGLPLALLATWFLIRTSRDRLGGITGDVLGAIVEVNASVVIIAAGLLSSFVR